MLQGWLATVDYVPPPHPGAVALDVVTVTCNRPSDLMEQSRRLAGQLFPQDRWIVVDDASRDGAIDPRTLIEPLPHPEQFLGVALSFIRQFPRETVTRARHLAASLARPDAWIVEIDDHDWLERQALDAVRVAICRGATAIYGDVQLYAGMAAGPIEHKPDYAPDLFGDCNPTSGLRAYPAWLYRAVGGYQDSEFPAGEYGLFRRFEEICNGQGIHRIPQVLCRRPLPDDCIAVAERARKQAMEKAIRAETILA